jgi:hypothetical protein
MTIIMHCCFGCLSGLLDTPERVPCSFYGTIVLGVLHFLGLVLAGLSAAPVGVWYGVSGRPATGIKCFCGIRIGIVIAWVWYRPCFKCQLDPVRCAGATPTVAVWVSEQPLSQ